MSTEIMTQCCSIYRICKNMEIISKKSEEMTGRKYTDSKNLTEEAEICL